MHKLVQSYFLKIDFEKYYYDKKILLLFLGKNTNFQIYFRVD